MTSKYPRFERHTNSGFTMPVVSVDWNTCDSTSQGELVKSGKRKGSRSNSAQMNYFLRLAAGQWWLKELKFQDHLNYEVGAWIKESGTWFVHDDSISALKTEKPLPVKVGSKANKLDKRLSRLVGKTLFGGWLDTAPTAMPCQPGTLLAIDGAPVVLCRADFETVVEQSITLAGKNEWAVTELKSVAHDLRTKLEHSQAIRLYGTLVTENAYFKGHFWIRNNTAKSYYFAGSEKTDLVLNEAGHAAFLAISPVHGTRGWIDVQTIAMHGSDGRYDALVDQAENYWAETLEAIRNGNQALTLERAFEISAQKHGLKEAGTWWPIEFFASGGIAGEWKAAADALLRGMHQQMKSSHGNMRIPSTGKRLYMCSAASAGMSVARGTFKTTGESCVFNSVDYVTADKRFDTLHALNAWIAKGGDVSTLEPGVAKVLGGGDADDLVLVYQYERDGIEYVQITRSPTFVGEIIEFGPDGIIWPAKVSTKFTGIKDTATVAVTGRTVADALKMVGRLRENAGVVGVAAKAIRYYVTTNGKLPDSMPMAMSDIVDAAVQDFRQLGDVKEFFTRLNVELAGESHHGNFIPRWIEDELAYSLSGKAGFKVAEPADDYAGKWFDTLMDRYETVLNDLAGEGGAMEELAVSAMPVPEFFQATEHAWPLAKAFRMHWGKFFMERPEDAAWNDETEKALTEHVAKFMGAYDERTQEDIVGASVALAYLKDYGAKLVKDYIGFSDATRELFFAFLRRNGIIGMPELVHGRLSIANIGREVEPKVHVPAYGLPKDGNLEGMTVAFERGFVQQKSGQKERLMIVDTATGTVLGYLPQDWLNRMVETMVVESVTEYEGKFVLSGQPVA